MGYGKVAVVAAVCGMALVGAGYVKAAAERKSEPFFKAGPEGVSMRAPGFTFTAGDEGVRMETGKGRDASSFRADADGVEARGDFGGLLESLGRLLGGGGVVVRGDRDAGPARRFERRGSVALGGATAVSVSADLASVMLKPGRGDRLEARLTGYAGEGLLGEVALDVRRDGDEVTVEARVPDDSSGGGKVSLELSLPRAPGATVSVRADMGSVVAERVAAKRFELETAMGSVTADRLEADEIAACSDMGAVKVRVAPGAGVAWKASSGMGTVTVFGRSGDAEGERGTGKLRVEASTGMGSVVIE